MTIRWTWVVSGIALASACGKKDEASPTSGTTPVSKAPAVPEPVPATTEDRDRRQAEQKLNMRSAPAGAAALAKDTIDGEFAATAPPDNKPTDELDFKRGGKGQSKEDEGTPSRSWFPESFLFEPLVVTDDHGDASISVKVPDRLTTYRILALAHSRAGAQGGAVASFLATLPAYVDPVTPRTLLAGDTLSIPLQLVNTTDAPIGGSLSVEAIGATISAAPQQVTVPADGSVVELIPLSAPRPGHVRLRAVLAGTDAVEKTIDVIPAGRPAPQTRSGTLAGPRTMTIAGPADSDPESDRVHVLVFPGALALVRAELASSLGRGGVAEDAYALALTGRAPALLRSFGDEPDPAALRDQAIVASQRVVRDARSPDVAAAALLAEAALAHPDDVVLGRIADRMEDVLARGQRPDGTFGGADGWTLQRLLVMTADGTRALRDASGRSDEARRRAQLGLARAQAAFERNAAQVSDGYTAAAILASGAVTGELAGKLRQKILDAVHQRDDGSRVVGVGDGVVRGDGLRPTEIEATALAALALAGDPGAPLADFGAALLGAYDPIAGWGDGRANIVCLTAVGSLFKDPIPPGVKITLSVDGHDLASGTIDKDHLRDVLTLDAPVRLAGPHTFDLRADPPVAGLGFSLTTQAWVPWQKDAARGVDLAVSPPATLTVGKPADLKLTAVAPGGDPIRIDAALPAGVQPDVASLEALVNAGTIERYELADGMITLHAPALAAGSTFSARLRVVPTLAGSLHAPASTITVADQAVHVPPVVWTIQ